jgi:CubicO group peptidase (beta-lactamase class C family)
LFTSQQTSAGEATGYGIGWRVGSFGELFPEDDPIRSIAANELRAMHHGGSSVGGRAFLLLIPEEHMVVALLVNYDRFDGATLAGRVATAFLEH